VVGLGISSLATPLIWVGVVPVFYVFWNIQNMYRQSARELKVNKRTFCAIYIYKSSLLPRQARDKHRENSKKAGFVAAAELDRSISECVAVSPFPRGTCPTQFDTKLHC
jgi:hypothetical protein